MKQHQPGRGDWLMVAVIVAVFVLVFWILFGRMLADLMGG